MTDHPHTPAAHINALIEEGTREELCEWLQKQWNEIVALRETLTPSAETKAAYIGEFRFNYTVWGPSGEDEITHHVTVPWTTIKEIMAAIRQRAEGQ